MYDSITWYFTEADGYTPKYYPVGYYVTGDPYVVVPIGQTINIGSITPAPTKCSLIDPGPNSPSDANPQWDTVNTHGRNGSMKNMRAVGTTNYGPTPWDDRYANGWIYQNCRRVNYRPLSCYDADLCWMPGPGCTLVAGDQLVSSRSLPNGATQSDYRAGGTVDGYARGNANSWGLDAAVLTVVDKEQPADAFRPPHTRPLTGPFARTQYSDSDPLRYRAVSVNKTLFRVLTLTEAGGDMSNIDKYIALFKRVAIHCPGWSSWDTWPKNNMYRYGRDLNDYGSVAHLYCMVSNPTDAAKQDTLINYMIQLGIDIYGTVIDGGSWVAQAGQHNGRKFPVMFAGLALGDSDMLNVGTKYKYAYGDREVGAIPKQFTFSEDGHCFKFDSTSIATYTNNYINGTGTIPLRNGVGQPGLLSPTGIPSAYLFFETNDTASWAGNLFYKAYAHIPPTSLPSDWYDSQSSSPFSYSHSCVMKSLPRTALFCYILDLVDEWNNPDFFGFCNQWMSESEGTFVYRTSPNGYTPLTGYYKALFDVDPRFWVRGAWYSQGIIGGEPWVSLWNSYAPVTACTTGVPP